MAQGQTAFRTLLYRYFFFTWLFRDVMHGTLFDRAAAWRYNQEQAHWLPTYMRRLFWWGLTLYTLGCVVELVLESPALSALFYVPSALTVPVNAVTVAVWVGLKSLPRPF